MSRKFLTRLPGTISRMFFVLAGIVLLSAGSSLAAVRMVEIDDDFYSPSVLTVNVGDTVRWTHIGTEGEPHTTTSKNGLWDSGPLMQGDTFEFQFMNTGSFRYTCFFHSEVVEGVIIVDGGIHDVHIGDDFFSPASITINVGDVVRWTHIGTEGEPHTSTSKTRIWNSGPLMEGDTFEYQFDEAGQFYYFCFFHSTIMHGLVIVMDGSSRVSQERINGTSLTISALDVPQETKLVGSYPNPFNPSTTIQYVLGHESHVSLKVYNSVGEEVATLVNEFQGAGTKTVTWNGKNNSGSSVASGLYIYTLEAGSTVLSEKVLLMK